MEYAEIKRQHDRLRTSLARLKGLLSNSVEQEGLDLVAEARALRRDLQEHFETEESEGYLDVVLEARPGWSRRVDRLREQHRDILRELNHLTELPVDEIKPNFRRTIEKVHQHDVDESDLMQEAVIEDLGSAD